MAYEDSKAAEESQQRIKLDSCTYNKILVDKVNIYKNIVFLSKFFKLILNKCGTNELGGLVIRLDRT